MTPDTAGNLIIRPATAADAELITAHRRAMFADMGVADAACLDRMSAGFLVWLREKIAEGKYLGWLACDGGEVAAGAGLWLMEWPPHVIGAGSCRGNVVNVYTRPDHRRRGLARRLMAVVLGWCTANGIDTVILHASDDGKALYESLGFQATNEMRLMLPPPGECGAPDAP